MTVGIGTGGGSTTPSEEELAEYEQERPARRLRPALDLAICGLVRDHQRRRARAGLLPITTRHAVLLGDLSRSGPADHAAVLPRLEGPFIYDNKDALVAVNVAAKGITLENADQTDPVPLHPGAKKAIDGLK